MHPKLLSSRALAALATMTLAAAPQAQGPAGGAQPVPASRAPDSVLLDAGRARLRGSVLASTRADLPDGDAALLVATQERPKGRVSFQLLVVGADGAGVYSLQGHDEVKSGELPGAPVVSLAVGAHPVAAGALTAVVGWKAPDGRSEEEQVLYRYGAGKLTQLFTAKRTVAFATGSGRAGTRNELDVLPTSSGGFRDLRVRTRECGADGSCGEPTEVASYRFDGVRYAERPNAIPFVERIEASSVLASPGGLDDRSAAAAIDGRVDTAWCEGARGPGWFEKLELTFVPAQRLKALTLLPGSGAGEPFGERARPKRIRVLLPDKTKFEADVADEPRAQRIALPEWDRVFGMTVVIVDVYKGKREDACIAELDLEVEP